MSTCLKYGVVILLLTFLMVASTSMGATCVWNPNVVYQCYSCNQATSPYLTPSQGLNCYSPENYSLPRDIFYLANEDYMTANPFIGFTYGWAVFPCTWTWQANPGSWTIQTGLNKYDYDIFRNQFTSSCFQDTIPTWPTDMRPTVNQNVWCYFKMSNVDGVVGYDGRDDGYGHPIGWGQTRSMLGVLGTWNGRSHYMEIVMWMTDGYDQITTTWNRWGSPPGTTWYDVSNSNCGLYQRRSWYSSGECVYLLCQNMNLLSGYGVSIPRLTTTEQEYNINIALAMRSVPWSDPPANWANAKIEGTYLGTEIWGAGKYIIKHRLFNTYIP